MSISSVLAFVIAGAAAKVKSVQVARRSEDRIAELEARIATLEDAIATANAAARRDQELIDIWRERALANVPAVIAGPAGPDFRPPQIAQQQHAIAQQQQAQMLQAQQNMAQAQQAQLAQYAGMQNYLNQQARPVGLLGAQSLIDAELWCNCVPARHDMFLRGS
jgi:hypothetical protein